MFLLHRGWMRMNWSHHPQPLLVCNFMVGSTHGVYCHDSPVSLHLWPNFPPGVVVCWGGGLIVTLVMKYGVILWGIHLYYIPREHPGGIVWFRHMPKMILHCILQPMDLRPDFRYGNCSYACLLIQPFQMCVYMFL